MNTIVKLLTAPVLIVFHIALMLVMVAIALVRWPLRMGLGAGTSVLNETHSLGEELAHEVVVLHSSVTETLGNITK